MFSHCLDDGALNVRRRDARDAARLPAPLLQERMGDIITVSRAFLVCMGRCHPIAAIVKDATREDCRGPSQAQLPGGGTGSELRLDGLE
jgi:hypothetical protein